LKIQAHFVAGHLCNQTERGVDQSGPAAAAAEHLDADLNGAALSAGAPPPAAGSCGQREPHTFAVCYVLATRQRTWHYDLYFATCLPFWWSLSFVGASENRQVRISMGHGTRKGYFFSKNKKKLKKQQGCQLDEVLDFFEENFPG